MSIRLKSGRHGNELTRFRYDVVLRKRGAGEAGEVTGASSAPATVHTLDALGAALRSGAERARAVDLRNARLAREVQAASLVSSMFEGATVADLRAALDASPDLAIDPEDAIAAPPAGFTAVATWARSGALDRFDVVAARAHEGSARTARLARAGDRRPWSAYANRPVRVAEGDALAPELRAFLRGRLPEYMVPSAFVVLDALPLTPNGKVDRKALPAPDRQQRASAEVYAPPSSDIERAMLGVWQDMLSLEQIGTRDNLFDLGANSFLMVQANGRLRAVLGKAVSLVDMFRFPTIGALSAHLGGGSGGGPDAGEDASAQEGQQRAAARKDAMQKRRDLRQRAR